MLVHVFLKGVSLLLAQGIPSTVFFHKESDILSKFLKGFLEKFLEKSIITIIERFTETISGEICGFFRGNYQDFFLE